MPHPDLTTLSDEDLQAEAAKLEHRPLVNATLIGLCFGIFIYSTVRNGLGFGTLLPMLLAYPIIKNGQRAQAFSQEVKRRNL